MTSPTIKHGISVRVVLPLALLAGATILALLMATGGQPAKTLLAALSAPTPTLEWPTAPVTSTPRLTRTPTARPQAGPYGRCG